MHAIIPLQGKTLIMLIDQEKVRAVRKVSHFGISFVIVSALWAYCSHQIAWETRALAASTPSYSADVAPILQKQCLSCHSSAIHKSGLILESYSALLRGGRHGQSIVPHDARGSLMVPMLEGDIEPQMPAAADPLPASDIELIKAWINAGAEGPVVV